MKQTVTQMALLAGLLAAPGLAQAQHYTVGLEGIKGASLPPPGVYFKDYNIGYYATRFEGQGGPPGFTEASVYVNAPRVIWISDYKILGANYGADVVVPFGYAHVKYAGFDHSSFGLGDIQVEPLLLAWHLKQFDIAAGYAVWMPTGESVANRADHLGLGFWGHMFTLGATAFFDQEKTWALSALNRFEINHPQDDTHKTYGDTYTLEWGLSKTLAKRWDVGLIGYYQTEVNSTTGKTFKKSVTGVGPEVSVAFPDQMLFVSLRYAREFASNRAEGNTFSLVITKKF